MDNIVKILGCFGDGLPHFKEEVYEVIRFSTRYTLSQIDKIVKKYLEYNLLERVVDNTITRGYYKYKITPKGEKALDYYRKPLDYSKKTK